MCTKASKRRLGLKIKDCGCKTHSWSRSFSEPDLIEPLKHLNSFRIPHPHEYISVDDLKYFRRKKSLDSQKKDNFYFLADNQHESPFPQSEYQEHYLWRDLRFWPKVNSLQRTTSLRLNGLMNHKSEHQEQYHWYSPKDWEFCRTYPIRNPENLRTGGGGAVMEPEYRSSFIEYPLVDRTSKILPREMFLNDNEADIATVQQPRIADLNLKDSATKKLMDDKFKRDVAAQEQHKCHLQLRAAAASKDHPNPSEYTRQYVSKFPIEKAHSIPQISHIKLHGDFVGIPEYQDSFKVYANYSKSAPIKKTDNLRISGAEAPLLDDGDDGGSEDIPEYRDKFCMNRPSKGGVIRRVPLKMDDHLRPRGGFTKDLPEYNESFRDPQVRQMPERGKCRESYLHPNGKLEFNPEYRNTYLDFPRSRPIVRKPASSLRLPISTATTPVANHTETNSTITNPEGGQRSPRHKYNSSFPQRYKEAEISTNIIATPEYRRASYNYQSRERTPTRKHSGAFTPTEDQVGKLQHKRRASHVRYSSVINPDRIASIQHPPAGKPPKFGRRASLLHNAVNCREHSSIVEGNPKYTAQMQTNGKFERLNQAVDDSFVVLNEHCKPSNWMKKLKYQS